MDESADENVRTCIMHLECVRDNNANMRREHEELANRVSIALNNSRLTLLHIQELNAQLQDMKGTIENALNNIHQPADEGPAEPDTSAQDLYEHLVNLISITVAAQRITHIQSEPVTQNERIAFEAAEVPEAPADPKALTSEPVTQNVRIAFEAPEAPADPRALASEPGTSNVRITFEAPEAPADPKASEPGTTNVRITFEAPEAPADPGALAIPEASEADNSIEAVAGSETADEDKS
ncbi:hypothetical protein KR018_006170 [Drosophila ironensis]|nr:hypothetical protein KR018_006170 [Drosophila ironensis]